MSIQDVTAVGPAASGHRFAVAGEQAAGLRAVADMIEAHPEVAELLRFALDSISAYAWTAEQMATFARVAAASGAVVRKDYPPQDSERHMAVYAEFGPVQLRLHTERAVVCERVVIGTEIVTKSVPDPERLANVPLINVEETVERVEWRCRPLLAAESEAGA